MKTILGTGQLGLVLLDNLLKMNPKENILVVNRSGRIAKALPGNVQCRSADVTNKTDMRRIAGESELLFSCMDAPYPLWKDFYPATTTALVEALKKTPVKLFFADNLYSYGNVTGEEMHKNLPHGATTRKGRIRTNVLLELLYTGEGYCERVAFVKASDFVGPGIHKGVFGTDFLHRVYNNKPVQLFGNISLPHTFTYLPDFANAMINVGHSSDAFGQVWHVPNAPALSIDKWVHLFEVVTGRRIRKKRIPNVLIRVAGLFNPLVKELYEMAY